MDKKQFLESIQEIDKIIKTQIKIKTQLQEAVLKDTFDKVSIWKNKKDERITAYIVGMNFNRQEVTVNTPHYREVVFCYSEFFYLYVPANL